MQGLPKNIARTQWNNRLKTVLLSMFFLAGIFVFSVVLMLMVVIPIYIFFDGGINVEALLHDQKVFVRFCLIFMKVLIASIGSAIYFVYRSTNNIELIFSAHRLHLKTTDSFYRILESKCIERGLKTPELYIFGDIIPAQTITAALVQGVNGRSAMIMTDGVFNLTSSQQEALAAQAVQRLYTKDTWFLTLFCFLGYFPFHMLGSINKIGRAILWLPMKAADYVIAPLRPLILDLRMARLDMGALEMTKDAEGMTQLLQKLATLDQVERYFYAPYLSLFIASSGDGRKEALTTS